METLRYEIQIAATPEFVWEVLTAETSYKEWVTAFSDNSYMVGEWKQGTEIDCLDPDYGGSRATLEVVDYPNEITMRHTALISKEGVLSTTGEEADKWIGTVERYLLSADGEKTRLVMENICHVDFKTMFDNACPVALATIKSLSEASDTRNN